MIVDGTFLSMTFKSDDSWQYFSKMDNKHKLRESESIVLCTADIMATFRKHNEWTHAVIGTFVVISSRFITDLKFYSIMDPITGNNYWAFSLNGCVFWMQPLCQLYKELSIPILVD